MAKFTATVPLNIKWYGNDLVGPAGTIHRIPDAFYDEFVAAFGSLIPGLTWVTTDETGGLLSSPIAQTDVTGLTAALATLTTNVASNSTALAGKVDTAGATMTGALTLPTMRAKGVPWYDVRAYGAVGDGTTDDLAAFNLAVAAASAGGIVYAPPGTYALSGNIGLTSGCTLQGAGRDVTVLKFTSNDYGIASTATIGTFRALSANAAVGDTTINVGALSSNFAAGDAVYLRDEGTALLAGHKRAELQTVLSVSGGLVNLAGSVMDIYTTANTATMAKYTPARAVHIRDLSAFNAIYSSSTTTATNPLIFFDFARDCSVTNVHLYQNNGKGIEFRNSAYCRVNGAFIEQLRDNEAISIYGYGIHSAQASRDIAIANTTFRNCRHGHTTGTGNVGQTPNYGVARNINLIGCTASDCTQAAFDTHEDSQGVSYTGCTVAGTQSIGFQTRGQYDNISSCMVRGARGAGILIDTSSIGVSITGTVVVNTSSTGAGAGSDGSGIAGGGNTRAIISGCLIADNAGNGIFLTASSMPGTVIVGNGIYGNALDGINYNVNATSVVMGNRIVSNGRYGMRFESGVSGTNSVSFVGNSLSSNATANLSNAGTINFLNLANSGAAASPGNVQRVTVSTGSIASAATADVTVTWPYSFGDGNYQVQVSCVESTGNLEVRAIKSVANGTITVTVKNNDASNARTGTLHAWAFHD